MNKEFKNYRTQNNIQCEECEEYNMLYDESHDLIFCRNCGMVYRLNYTFFVSSDSTEQVFVSESIEHLPNQKNI